MGTVALDITMSLDGFVTGPDAGIERGLGIGGEPLHDWVSSGTETDTRILENTAAAAGAVLMGRRTFDVVDGPRGWAEEVDGTAPPVIVVTSSKPARVRLGERFSFVDDLTEALARAQQAAGDKDIVIMGGGHLCRQYLYAGLVDEVRIHLAPIVLGDGTPLFERTAMTPVRLVQRDVTVTPAATHITYGVER